jgi:hypothetical protein
MKHLELETHKDYKKILNLQIEKDSVLDIVAKNSDKFFCPFSNKESYLHIYEGRDCTVQFFNLQECDYSKELCKDGIQYIRYLMSVEKKLGNEKTYNYLKQNYKKFTIEMNEENFIITDEDPDIQSLIKNLENMWGPICRTRIVKVPANTDMPYHKDETSKSNTRIISPLITYKTIQNAFRNKKGEESFYHIPATGHFYTFDDVNVDHAVFNNSNIDRYALIFTIINRII